MGLIGKILSTQKITRAGAAVRRVMADYGGGDIKSTDLYSCPGDDAAPLPGDFAGSEDGRGTGAAFSVGVVDPLNAQKAAPGDRRLYGRNAAGVEMCQIWLKGTGEIEISNTLGNIKLLPTGSVSISNGLVTIDLAGNIITAGAISAAALTVTGALAAATIAATTTITAATITATGAIVGASVSAATVTASGAIAAASAAITGSITCVDCVAGIISLLTHKASAVTTGPGVSGPPVP